MGDRSAAGERGTRDDRDRWAWARRPAVVAGVVALALAAAAAWWVWWRELPLAEVRLLVGAVALVAIVGLRARQRRRGPPPGRRS